MLRIAVGAGLAVVRPTGAIARCGRTVRCGRPGTPLWRRSTIRARGAVRTRRRRAITVLRRRHRVTRCHAVGRDSRIGRGGRRPRRLTDRRWLRRRPWRCSRLRRPVLLRRCRRNCTGDGSGGKKKRVSENMFIWFQSSKTHCNRSVLSSCRARQKSLTLTCSCDSMPDSLV